MNSSNILISDYDQTFYINDEDIEKNKLLVKEFRNKGNILVFATGRSYEDFKEVVNKYNLEYDYAIINHGATILNEKEQIISNFEIPNSIIENIKQDIQIEKSIRHFCCRKFESRLDFDSKDLTKINIRYNSKEEAIQINDIINKKYSDLNSYYIPHNLIEIISSKTNKANAINILLNELDISNAKVYVIGDGYSDIEMIKQFNGYAMKNSVDELKTIATKQYNSVSELIKEIMWVKL